MEVFMTGRYNELDSLRGLAALAVFFSHMYLIFNETLISKLLFEYGLLRVTVAGSEAVVLFFVLSGFVLSLPFYSNQQFNYGAYAIKRFCRIYIPYIMAIVIAILCRELFYTEKIGELSNWFNVNWSTSLNVNSLTDHLLLIGTFTSSLNNVVWSLVHELRISLIFPMIMFLLVRFNPIQGIGLAIAFSSVSIIYSFITNAPFLGTELYSTIHYCSMFVIGALLAKYRRDLTDHFLTLSTKYKGLLFLTGVVLYVYAHPSFILNMLIADLNPFYRTVIDSWFISLGAGIIMIVGISSNLI
jgi:peptidoglycan/LPS O-acetylase OafA/YrhL